MGRRRKRRNLAGTLPAPPPPPDVDWSALKAGLRREAEANGGWLAGFTTADPAASYPQYEEWVERGYHGEMGYLARPDRLERRRDLSVILEGVQSVIPVLLPYWPGQTPPEHQEDEQQRPARGKVSCYAWGTDYHETLGAILKRLAHWLVDQVPGAVVWYVDTGAIQERDLAARAGLGFLGKNTLLLHPKYGSGFFIGELLCTHPFPPDAPPRMPGCGTCQRCLVACPTQAFVGPHLLDARRCISYLTIEHKGSIPEDLRPLMGTWIYGCDVCQDVCPWNRFAGSSPSPLWGEVPTDTSAPVLIKLMQLDEDGFQQRFAHTPIARLGRVRFLRNVAVALGNAGDPTALPVLREAREDPDALIREHAAWALRQLASNENSREVTLAPGRSSG